MKKTTTLSILTTALLLMLAAGCSLDAPSDPTDQVNAPTIADADAQYVAMGNSLTAGFMDGGLMMAGQTNSFPQIIAAQLGLDREQFSQPWIAAPGVGSLSASAGHAAGVLYFNGTAPVKLAETPLDQVPALLLAAAQPTPYHNLGVPGARLAEARATYNSATSFGAAFGTPNSYFDFINRADALMGNVSVPADAVTGFPAYETASMFWQTIAQGPALVTLWLGANDVLGAAMSGEPMSYPAVTDPTVFGPEYATLLGSLAGGLAKRNGFPATIVTATVPMVSNAAYFLSAADFAVIAPGFGSPGFVETNVQYVLLLDFLSWVQSNPGQPLAQQLTLDQDEVDYLTQVIGGYNLAISQATAQINGLGLAHCAVMDANAALSALTADQKRHFMYLWMLHGGTETVAEVAARTYFSLDGVHPNNVGYAYLANRFMAAINTANDAYDFTDVPLAAFTWDPTYAMFGGGIDTKAGGVPRVDPATLAEFKALFR